MEFGILGPLEVRDAGRPVVLGGPKPRALLAMLLLSPNRVVAVDRLVDALWGETPPPSAEHMVQGYVSELRKLLRPAHVIERRPPGYTLSVDPRLIDLARFEKLVEDAEAEFQHGRATRARELFRDGLALWRGDALADLAREGFAPVELARLEELREAALERRIDADLASGRGAELVGELRTLVRSHPFRERFYAQLMVALYRSGRQAEALEVYRSAWDELVGRLGVEPGQALRELEQSILRSDPELDASGPGDRDSGRGRSVLVAAVEVASLAGLVSLAEPLARDAPGDELIVSSLVSRDATELEDASRRLAELRDALLGRGISARSAAFTSERPGSDVVRLARAQDTKLLLLECPAELFAGRAPSGDMASILGEAPCDVALAILREADSTGGPVLVPFGGSDHDWAAVELAAWWARAQDVELVLAGVADGAPGEGRDASRLLADVSLVLQRYVGIAAQPRLIGRRVDELVGASADAGLVVAGITERWRSEGLGPVRAALARGARSTTLLVRRGIRPGGLAPRERLTQFTWSLAAGPYG
jgi:DNA-binding SARP family transcriptional activator